jgi:hypothetical protein
MSLFYYIPAVLIWFILSDWAHAQIAGDSQLPGQSPLIITANHSVICHQAVRSFKSVMNYKGLIDVVLVHSTAG